MIIRRIYSHVYSLKTIQMLLTVAAAMGDLDDIPKLVFLNHFMLKVIKVRNEKKRKHIHITKLERQLIR